MRIQRVFFYVIIGLLLFSRASVSQNSIGLDISEISNCKEQPFNIFYKSKKGWNQPRWTFNTRYYKNNESLVEIKEKSYSISNIASCKGFDASLLIANQQSMNSSAKGEDMLNISQKSLIIGALFIPTMITGYKMAQGGHPPNSFLLTIHKLTSVANLILLDRMVYQRHKITPFDANEKAAILTMNACFIGTIVTGALMTVNADMPKSVHVAHRYGPWLSILSSGVLLYLFGR